MAVRISLRRLQRIYLNKIMYTQVLEMDELTYHYPVMYREIVGMINPSECNVIVDCTLGMGGHTLKFLDLMKENAMLIGLDRDRDSLDIASEKIGQRENVKLVKADFSKIDAVLDELNIDKVDAVLFDFGISMYQMKKIERGFSFANDGPLDMRMDKDVCISAYDLVNNLSESELADIFFRYGEERFSRRIVRMIVSARRDWPITTTQQLAELVVRAVPIRSFKYKIHPATRVFQALRIAVNNELEVIADSLKHAVGRLNSGGRIAVISFHSLEDRIVKHTFKELAACGDISILTKKPLVPSENEKNENNASRSAKLRVAQKS